MSTMWTSKENLYISKHCWKLDTDDTGQEYKLSFKELDNITNQLARALQKYEKFETTSQSLIAVCMKPSHRLPTVLLSILKAGMAYLPLDVEFPMSRVKHILEEAQPLIVLVEEGGKFLFLQDANISKQI